MFFPHFFFQLEEQDFGEEIQPASIRGYLADYKNFSEKITLVLKTVVSEETTQEEMTQGITDLQELQAELDGSVPLSPSFFSLFFWRRLMWFFSVLISFPSFFLTSRNLFSHANQCKSRSNFYIGVNMLLHLSDVF